MNQTMSSFRDTQLKHQADFANYMLQSSSPEHPLTPATSLAAAKVAQANGLANTDDINKMMAAFNQGKDPTEVFTAIANYGKEGQKNIVVKKDERVYSPTGKLLIPAEAAPGEGQHVINGQLIGPDGQPIGPQVPPQVTPAELETQRHNKALEDAAKLQYGREAAVNAETARHNRTMEGLDQAKLKASQAGAPSAAGAGIPDVPVGQKNEDFLKTLPTPIAAQVKALVEGRQSFPQGAALRSDYWQNMLGNVAKYDPSFDAVNYNARSKTRADFTSGKAAQQVNAINTVIGHLSGLSDAAEALNNSDIPAFNSIANSISKATGSPKVTNFDTIKKAVSDEVTRVWRQSGGSEADIQAAQKNLDASGSPAQLRGAIATYAGLLESKLGSLNEQYRQGMGTDKIDMITPGAQKALDAIEKRAGRAPAAGAGRVVVGGIPFPSQAAADKALADWQAKQGQK
jgi:hypothetical protein